jgi:hypothetical protein
VTKIAGVRILTDDSNARGDLFGRLVSDLFLALGYADIRLNVHKTGREIDATAQHRTEMRRVVAECKALAAPVGGADINKFVGILDAERRKTPLPTVGYFLSLSGFTESAVEQERELGNDRVTLLDGRRAIQELINGRIVVAPARAFEQAGRCATTSGCHTPANEDLELLAHPLGWLWLVYFGPSHNRTHFALIHADGTALSEQSAADVIQRDAAIGGKLSTLAYLKARTDTAANKQTLDRAQAQYFNYLAAECGEIELEGMPADQDVGSRRLRLEQIFVPLRLAPIITDDPAVAGTRKRKRRPSKPAATGHVLTQEKRIAILAPPGAGKSTLVKRLATAYAFPSRRAELGDMLPDQEWFPLLLRCRSLGGRTSESIRSIVANLGERAELGELAEPFVQVIDGALREGRVLLLVDGLDEIADPRARTAFVGQLRTFLAVYPGVALVLTSREAGFRHVAPALAGYCSSYRLAEFRLEDIERLSVAWHREVVGTRPAVEADARALAHRIWGLERVRQLATNPLLLTTLLLVKRWVGQLPSRRTVLYEKAIEVLLMTWNVQGHEPLDTNEVIPQLCFVAKHMMDANIQRISLADLKRTLQTARRQMPEVLQFAQLSPSDFIDRVELRSSILVLAGHELSRGNLVATYEFRHLTFQEYFAAKGLVEGYYEGRSERDTLVKLLRPHLRDPAWREVIPLAAVLAGRQGAQVITALVKEAKARKGRELGSEETPFEESDMLTECLLDEVIIPPRLVDEALETIARVSQDWMEADSGVARLSRSKYAESLRRVTWNAFKTSKTDLLSLADAIHRIEAIAVAVESDDRLPIDEWLKASDRDRRVTGLIALMNRAYSVSSDNYKRQGVDLPAPSRSASAELGAWAPACVPALTSKEPWEQVAGAWALAWLSSAGAASDSVARMSLPRLFELWRSSKVRDVRYVAAWAFGELPLVSRDATVLPGPRPTDITKLRSAWERPRTDSRFERRLAIVAAYYWRRPWSDVALAEMALELVTQERPRSEAWSKAALEARITWALEMVRMLGDAGKVALLHLEESLRRAPRDSQGTFE